MSQLPINALRAEILERKEVYLARLDRISSNLQRGFNADSKEMAKELEDQEVVDALGNEARREIAKISAALARMDDGSYGRCRECAEPIQVDRMIAFPYADECIECARIDERSNARSS